MADFLSVKIEGARELEKGLLRLANPRRRRAVVRSGVRAGSRVIIKAIKQRAPKETGRLKRALTQQVKWDSASGEMSSRIGAKSKKVNSRNAARYLHLVEQGARPHQIVPSTKMALRLGVGKGKRGRDEFGRFTTGGIVTVFATVARHPGTSASRFMQAGFKASAQQAVAKFVTQSRAALLKEVLKERSRMK